MKHPLLATAALALATPSQAQEAEPPTPASIVAEAPASDWRAIDPADLLVMTLAPDEHGDPRTVVIQLIPPPFSQGWVENVRTLAKAHWWDGTSVYRVVDNWVAQWGDGEDDKAKAKPLPEGLRVVAEGDYVTRVPYIMINQPWAAPEFTPFPKLPKDNIYAEESGFVHGWPVGLEYYPRGKSPFNRGRRVRDLKSAWPVHCYA